MLDKILLRLVENNFSELAGLTVDASIPLPESLVNEIVQSTLRGNQNITSCHLSIRRENRLTVDLRTPKWPWPLNLKLRLFGSVDLSSSPKIRAFLENNVLLGKLGAFFKALPEGITLYNNQVTVDLGPFLPQEQVKLLALIKSVAIRTEEKKLILEVEIER